MYHGEVIQWGQQGEIGDVSQQPVGRLLDIGIHVHRIDELHPLLVFTRQARQGAEDALERLAKIFPAMGGNQHQSGCLRIGHFW